jgi:methionyl-tRNA formyltransferase
LKAALLGKKSRLVERAIHSSGWELLSLEEPITESIVDHEGIHWAISYGYRHIVPKRVIDALDGRILNLHISLLPWNRGADPNLWSFLEDTPKGVSVHFIDTGIDTGDLVCQSEMLFEGSGHTLRTTYQILSDEVESLFVDVWPKVIASSIRRRVQPPGGSFHYLKDKERFKCLLEEFGWDTPVETLIGKAIDIQASVKK